MIIKKDTNKKYMKIKSAHIKYKYLPSSSSLNAMYSLDEKAKIWKKIIKG